jgi:hypothetical protein
MWELRFRWDRVFCFRLEGTRLASTAKLQSFSTAHLV